METQFPWSSSGQKSSLSFPLSLELRKYSLSSLHNFFYYSIPVYGNFLGMNERAEEREGKEGRRDSKEKRHLQHEFLLSFNLNDLAWRKSRPVDGQSRFFLSVSFFSFSFKFFQFLSPSLSLCREDDERLKEGRKLFTEKVHLMFMVCQRASTSTWEEEEEEEESDLVYHWIPKYILLFPSHTMTTNNHVCRWDVLWPKRSIVVFVVSSCGSRTSSVNRTWRKRARTYTFKFEGKKDDWMNDGRERRKSEKEERIR